MNYTKPQLNTMGDARNVIASGQTVKPPMGTLEAHSSQYVIPAYDLDE
jgi:hypothetical protein